MHNNPQFVHQLESCFIIMDNNYISKKCRMIIKNSTGLSLVKITFDQSNVKNVGRKMRQSVFQMKPFTRIYASLVLVLLGYYLAQGSIKVNCILQIS